MAEHVETPKVVINALQDQQGKKFKHEDGGIYVLTGFHPGVLVMKDSDGKWYDACQYVAFHEGDDKTQQIYVRRAEDFANSFEVVVE